MNVSCRACRVRWRRRIGVWLWLGLVLAQTGLHAGCGGGDDTGAADDGTWNRVPVDCKTNPRACA